MSTLSFRDAIHDILEGLRVVRDHYLSKGNQEAAIAANETILGFVRTYVGDTEREELRRLKYADDATIFTARSGRGRQTTRPT